jgi:flavodoxin
LKTIETEKYVRIQEVRKVDKLNGSVSRVRETEGVLPTKSLLVVYSYHHNNTEKIADVFAKVLGAQIKTPQQINLKELQEYDLIGFGSGIDSDKHYQVLLDFADNLPQLPDKNVIIFSTSGITGEEKREKDHSALRGKLQDKGCRIVGEFQCRGFNTNSFLGFFGGMNKGRPNAEDLKRAEDFAQDIKQSLQLKRTTSANSTNYPIFSTSSKPISQSTEKIAK